MERGQLPKNPLLASSSTTDHDPEKKIARKEIERQRRLQMSTLFGSLRSLIPRELIKGNLSTSDLISGAVNHINYQRNKTKELSAKRDELKRLAMGSGGLGNDQIASSSANQVSVRHYFGGIKIVLAANYGLRDEGFLLSRVLQVVVEEGLDVVNCVHINKKDEAFGVTNIQCQASDFTCIDLDGLQQKLQIMVKMSPSFASLLSRSTRPFTFNTFNPEFIEQ